MRVLLQSLGALVALGLLVVSASMNWRFGLHLGTTEIDGYIYGTSSVLLDCLKVLLPFFIAYAFRSGMRLRVAVGCAMWIMFTGYSLTSAIGFSSKNRLESAGVQLQQVDKVSQARKDIARLQEQIKGLKAHRSLSVVSAELEGVKARQFRYKGRYASLAEITNNCVKPVGSQTRRACALIAELRVERAIASQDYETQKKIEKLQSVLAQSNGLAVLGSTDSQVSTLKELSGLSENGVRLLLIVMIAIVVEIGSNLGMFLSLDRGDSKQEYDDESLAIRYLHENVIESKGSTIQASEIHGNYAKWIEKVSKNTPMTLTSFGKFLTSKGLKKERLNGCFHYIGMKLI